MVVTWPSENGERLRYRIPDKKTCRSSERNKMTICHKTDRDQRNLFDSAVQIGTQNVFNTEHCCVRVIDITTNQSIHSYCKTCYMYVPF